MGSSPVDFVQCIDSVVMATLIKHGVYLRVTEKNAYLRDIWMRKCSVLCKDLGSTDSMFLFRMFPYILNLPRAFHLNFLFIFSKVNKFMLLVLYCYMRNFRACEPPEQYLLFTLSADMCPCTESGIVADFACTLRRQILGELCLFHAG